MMATKKTVNELLGLDDGIWNGEQSVVVASMHELANMCSHLDADIREANVRAIESTNGFREIFSVIKHWFMDADIRTVGCEALAGALAEPCFVANKFGDYVDEVEIVADAMKAHPKGMGLQHWADPKILGLQHWAGIVLKHLERHSNVTRNEAYFKKRIGGLCQDGLWSREQSVVMATMHELANMCTHLDADRETNVREINNVFGFRTICCAMMYWYKVADIQTAGCEAIANALAQPCFATQNSFCGVDIAEIVKTARKNFPEDMEVEYSSRMVLNNLEQG